MQLKLAKIKKASEEAQTEEFLQEKEVLAKIKKGKEIFKITYTLSLAKTFSFVKSLDQKRLVLYKILTMSLLFKLPIVLII